MVIPTSLHLQQLYKYNRMKDSNSHSRNIYSTTSSRTGQLRMTRPFRMKFSASAPAKNWISISSSCCFWVCWCRNPAYTWTIKESGVYKIQLYRIWFKEPLARVIVSFEQQALEAGQWRIQFHYEEGIKLFETKGESAKYIAFPAKNRFGQCSQVKRWKGEVHVSSIAKTVFKLDISKRRWVPRDSCRRYQADFGTIYRVGENQVQRGEKRGGTGLGLAIVKLF